jgi:DNA adenine methylase
MQQNNLFDLQPIESHKNPGQIAFSTPVINVSSQQQLSPFRYPGGKTWFLPYLKRWLATQPRSQLFIEAFAGGASVGCAVAYENLADHVMLIELDPTIAAVWRVTFSDSAQDLAARITSFHLSHETVASLLASSPISDLDVAFQTIVRNRVNRGGILAPGVGLMKTGENGNGLHSRWYPTTLAKRILALSALQKRVSVVCGDGTAALAHHSSPNTLAFIDPPYTAGGKRAGSRLYTHNNIDHNQLFGVAQEFAGEFLMTYDNNHEVMQLAKLHGFATTLVSMKNTHHAITNELVIARSLGWL